ncbi:MAG: DUF6492 family protein [Pseudomonadota bacterium]
MKDIVLFCKSYSRDIFRAVGLVNSAEKFNTDRIPFYVSVPRDDLTLFKEHLGNAFVNLIADEEILEASFKQLGCRPADILPKVPGHLMQQIVKAEFWRLLPCRNYLVIDSDSYFVRPFSADDFLFDETVPYTVMHESKEILQFAARSGRKDVIREYIELRREFKGVFGRRGRHFDFGPTPVIWSKTVWEGISENHAIPRGTNIFEMICKHPCELLWYGEYLLHATPFPIIPVEPLFKVYHYKEQYDEGQRLGESDRVIAQNFLGVVLQSNWNRSLDAPRAKPSILSRFFKKQRENWP